MSHRLILLAIFMLGLLGGVGVAFIFANASRKWKSRANGYLDILTQASIGIIWISETLEVKFINRFLTHYFPPVALEELGEYLIQTSFKTEKPLEEFPVTVDGKQFSVSSFSHHSKDGSLCFCLIPVQQEIFSGFGGTQTAVKFSEMDSIRVIAQGLAHELKNPITSIKVLLQMMDPQSKPSKEVAAQFKGILSFEIERLDRIIGDFLHFADPGDLILKQENLMDVIAEVEQIVHRSYPNAGFRLTKEVHPVPKLMIDRKKVVQVLLNLIVNAIDSVPEIGGQIAILLQKEDDRVQIVIANNGNMISPADQSKIFLPFFSTKKEGVGLGLSICKKVVEQHQGRVMVSSKPGENTSFTIVFPVNTQLVPNIKTTVAAINTHERYLKKVG